MNYYNKIKEIIINNNITKNVNNYFNNRTELESYYNVGKIIIEAQGGESKAKYGNKLIKEYSMKLTKELGKGYSETTLKSMRKYYLYQKSQQVVDFLPWGYYTILLSLKDYNELNYYKNICLSKKISRSELKLRIKTNEYGRLPMKTKEKIIKGERLEFIENIPNPIFISTFNNELNNIKEKTLKQIIIRNLDSFLKQLGNSFTYVGNEYQIKIDNRYYYIDMLLFNVEFNCYVAIELKITELKKEHVGQIRFYMNYIDNCIKRDNHNKTIGLIICKKNNELVLEYSSDSRIYSREFALVKI